MKSIFNKEKASVYLLLTYQMGILFLIYTISRLLFYAVNHSFFPEITTPHLLQLMAAGVVFDISALIYINAIYIVGQLIPFRFRESTSYQLAMKWIFLSTNSIGLLFNCIDFAYFRFTLKRTTFSVFKEMSNELHNANLGVQLVADYWWIGLILVFLIALMTLSFWKPNQLTTLQIKTPFYYPISFLVMAPFVGLAVLGIRGKLDDRPINIDNASKYVNNPIEIAIVLNTPFSLIRTMDKQQLEAKHYFSTQELENLYSPIHLPKNEELFTPKNVVIIILEGFGSENSALLNSTTNDPNYVGYTPFLDSLMTQSYTFTYSIANGKKSIDAIPSVISSIPGFPDSYLTSIYSSNKMNSLAKLLHEKGYQTSFFHGAPRGSMRILEYTSMAGFETYYGQEDYHNDADYDQHWGIWDEPFFQYTANTLKKTKQPFFASLFSLTSHHPFRIPAKYDQKFPKGEAPIHKTIGYTDYALRAFFETVKSMEWYKNTLFVITGDHTNGAFHDQYRTSVGIFKVPILFFDPTGTLNPQLEPIVAQQIDIMPTVLDYLKYDKPYFAFGQSLLSRNSKSYFGVNYTNGYFQLFQDCYVLLSKNENPVSLFNYQTDPLLKNNLLNQEPARANQLESLQKAFIQQYNNRLIENKTVCE